MAKGSGYLRSVIEANQESIVSAIKKESMHKEYFQGLALPPEQFLEVIIVDWLETIIVCHETGSMTIFLEKLKWFKEMYSSRHQARVPLQSVLDFFSEVKKQVRVYGHNEPYLEDLFLQMDDAIKEILKGGD